jgi:hypothetical protein
VVLLKMIVVDFGRDGMNVMARVDLIVSPR